MNGRKFVLRISEKLQEFGVMDAILRTEEHAIIIPIDAEDGVPGYRLAVNVIQNEYVTMDAAFLLKTDDYEIKRKLLRLCNDFNNQTFLKFIVTKKYLKVTYTMPEVDDSHLDQVIRTFTIIPAVFAEFYPDLKEYIC